MAFQRLILLPCCRRDRIRPGISARTRTLLFFSTWWTCEVCFHFSAPQKLPSALCRAGSTWLSPVPAPFARTSRAGRCWDDPLPRARSPARGKVPLGGTGQLGSDGVSAHSSHFPSWDLLCTLVWVLYGKEVLVGQGLGAPLNALSAVAQPAPGEGAVRPMTPKSHAVGRAVLEVPSLGAGPIRLLWECGGSRRLARRGLVGPQNSAESAGAGLWWLLQHTEAGAVPVERGLSRLFSGEGQGINFIICFAWGA